MAATYIAGQDGSIPESRGAGIPDWRELITIIIERIWYGIAVAIAVMLFFYWQMTQIVPMYRSTALLMVEGERPRILQQQEVVSPGIRNLDYFNTVINVLHSRQMMETALQESGLAEHPDFLPHITSLAGKTSAALRLVNIRPVDRSRLIRITVEHTDPVLASKLANAMAQAYIKFELEHRQATSMQVIDWLQERANESRERVQEGMLALHRHREDAQSVSLKGNQDIVLANIASLNSSLTRTKTERIAVQIQWETINRQIAAGLPRTRIAPQMEGGGLSEAHSMLRRHRRELGTLRNRYLEGHPDVVAAVGQEKHLKQLFDEAFEEALFALQNRMEILQLREESLRAALQEQEREAFEIARQLLHYDELNLNVNAEREMFEAMITRMQQVNVSETLPAELLRLVDEARPAGSPFHPNRPRLMTRSAFFAGAAGLGFIFLLYYTDHRFRRNEEVERSLGVPVLTFLPIISGRDTRERGLVALDKPTGEVAEGFRTLRAMLEMQPEGEHAKVTLLTSTQPAEGKSLISVNLAISHARNHKRTLLIGADMRRPSFRKLFSNLKAENGLSNVLKGELRWQDAVQSCGVDNLDILEAGKGSSRPAEILGDDVLRTVMGEIREYYDRILIDSPPVLGVSDTLIILKYVDAVLFVVRYGVTHSLGAMQAMRRIRTSETPCLGAIMNGVDMRSVANYYYYRRYGGYGYYGYTRAAKPTLAERREIRRSNKRKQAASVNRRG